VKASTLDAGHKAVDFLHKNFRLFSRERLAFASKSELRRWCDAGSVHFNAEPVAWDELINFPISSVVIFPGAKRQITLW
jgi:hypothetical protein